MRNAIPPPFLKHTVLRTGRVSAILPSESAVCESADCAKGFLLTDLLRAHKRTSSKGNCSRTPYRRYCHGGGLGSGQPSHDWSEASQFLFQRTGMRKSLCQWHSKNAPMQKGTKRIKSSQVNGTNGLNSLCGRNRCYWLVSSDLRTGSSTVHLRMPCNTRLGSQAIYRSLIRVRLTGITYFGFPRTLIIKLAALSAYYRLHDYHGPVITPCESGETLDLDARIECNLCRRQREMEQQGHGSSPLASANMVDLGVRSLLDFRRYQCGGLGDCQLHACHRSFLVCTSTVMMAHGEP